MEIYNTNMELIEKPDLSLGYLKEDIRIQHHEAIEGIEEVWHYETIAEYPNGGKDVIKVIDIPGIEAKDAWDEEIPIQIYIPYTEEELENIKIEKNKPSRLDVIEAQLAYVAMMTDNLLEV